MKTVFGKNILELREKNNITRKELADALEIPVTTLQGYETTTREARYDVLIKIADYFGLSVDQLLRRKNENPLTSKDALILRYRVSYNLLLASYLGIRQISQEGEPLTVEIPVEPFIEQSQDNSATVANIQVLRLTFTDDNVFCATFEGFLREAITKKISLSDVINNFVKINHNKFEVTK